MQNKKTSISEPVYCYFFTWWNYI